MYYTKSFIDKFTKEQSLQFRDDMLHKISSVVKIADSTAYDCSFVLPSNQRIDVSIMMSDTPWDDHLVCPIKVVLNDKNPHLLWFVTVTDDVISHVSSLKFSTFRELSIDEIGREPKKTETDNFQVRLHQNRSPRIQWGLLHEFSGFSINPLKSYSLPFETLMDDRIRFSFFEFTPRPGTIDDGFWLMVHLQAALQSNVFANYQTLWTRYQEYLVR